MDLADLIKQLMDTGEFYKLTRNPLAQFGNRARNRVYLGATLLPEIARPPMENNFTEEDIAIRALIADDTTRYSPAQKKNRIETQALDIVLGEIDAGREFHASHIDTLNRLLMAGNQLSAISNLIGLLEQLGVQPLMDKKELQRWQAIVTARVQYKGTGNKDRIIQFEDPIGHRFTAGGNWSDDAYNPFDDFEKARNTLEEAGYTLGRIICRGKPLNLMQANASVQTKVGRITIDPNLQLQATGQLSGRNRIQGYLTENDFPNVEVYNLDYYTQTTRQFFIPDDVMIFIGNTPRNYALGNDSPGDEMLLYNTLGYYAVGTPQAQTTAGDVVRAYYHDRKPANIQVEAYGTGLPILQESEAIIVCRGIS